MQTVGGQELLVTSPGCRKTHFFLRLRHSVQAVCFLGSRPGSGSRRGSCMVATWSQILGNQSCWQKEKYERLKKGDGLLHRA